MGYDVRNQGYWFSAEQLAEHDKQIRADAIEPIKAIIQESERMMWHSDKTLEKIKEQLKEQTK